MNLAEIVLCEAQSLNGKLIDMTRMFVWNELQLKSWRLNLDAGALTNVEWIVLITNLKYAETSRFLSCGK